MGCPRQLSRMVLGWIQIKVKGQIISKGLQMKTKSKTSTVMSLTSDCTFNTGVTSLKPPGAFELLESDPEPQITHNSTHPNPPECRMKSGAAYYSDRER